MPIPVIPTVIQSKRIGTTEDTESTEEKQVKTGMLFGYRAKTDWVKCVKSRSSNPSLLLFVSPIASNHILFT